MFGALKENWTKDFIYDIRILPEGQSKCGTEQDLLFYYPWYGINQGCNCILTDQVSAK